MKYRFASTLKPKTLPAWVTETEKGIGIWYYFELDLEHPGWKVYYSQQETADIKLALTAIGFESVYKMP